MQSLALAASLSAAAFDQLRRSSAFFKQEVAPGSMKRPALENLIRSAAISGWHQSCTAKMGRDSMSVVDANLKVYGIENLRTADISVMARNRAAKSQRSSRPNWCVNRAVAANR